MPTVVGLQRGYSMIGFCCDGPTVYAVWNTGCCLYQIHIFEQKVAVGTGANVIGVQRVCFRVVELWSKQHCAMILQDVGIRGRWGVKHHTQHFIEAVPVGPNLISLEVSLQSKVGICLVRVGKVNVVSVLIQKGSLEKII